MTPKTKLHAPISEGGAAEGSEAMIPPGWTLCNCRDCMEVFDGEGYLCPPCREAGCVPSVADCKRAEPNVADDDFDREEGGEP